MKKLIILLLIIVIAFITTGCTNDVSKEKAEKLDKAFHKNKIISSNDKFIEIFSRSKYSQEAWFTTTYYIYEKSNGSLMAIHYAKPEDREKCNYTVTIYDDVTLNQNYDEVESNLNNDFSPGYDRYIIEYDNTRKYCVVEKKFLFINRYIITKEV